MYDLTLTHEARRGNMREYTLSATMPGGAREEVTFVLHEDAAPCALAISLIGAATHLERAALDQALVSAV